MTSWRPTISRSGHPVHFREQDILDDIKAQTSHLVGRHKAGLKSPFLALADDTVTIFLRSYLMPLYGRGLAGSKARVV